jgi:hypothetical protein
VTTADDNGAQDEPVDFKEQLARLREDVDILLTTRDTTTRGPDVPDSSWQAMSPARAGDVWRALIEWVDDLVDRYALDETIPICWYAHGAMVEELHALHIAWLGAYTGRAGQPTDRALWQELLARTLTRLRDWNRHGCAAGTHRDDEPVEPTEQQRTARAAFVHADIHARAERDGALPLEIP